jgi:glycosyltransferase involved in cell wall biosynthesis
MVTVLMPVYNAEKYVAEAIESILNQTFQDFEFLIINDGSTDSSVEIIQSYRDPRIRLLNLEQNVGLVKALNIGLSEIHSEYIVRTDADDISLPNRIETQLNFMQQNGAIGVCGSWFDTINETGIRKDGVRYLPSDEEIRLKHLYQIHLSHGTAIFRNAMLKENSIFYSSFFDHAEDYDIFDRIGTVSQLANIQQVLYVVRLHDSNVSKTFGHVQRDNSLGVKRRIFKRLGVGDISDSDIHIYQELQHQNYRLLAERQNEVMHILSRLFTANAETGMFHHDFFRKHLSTLWFHYCNSVANSNSWTTYHDASFIDNSDLSTAQKIKFRIKSYLR